MGTPQTGQTFTSRIAYWSAVHRWLILAASALVIVLAVLSIGMVGADTRDDESGVGESGQGTDLLRERFNTAAATPETTSRTRREGVIFSSASLEVDDPRFRDAVDSTIQSIRELPQVIDAVSFYDTNDARMQADDGKAVLAAVIL